MQLYNWISATKFSADLRGYLTIIIMLIYLYSKCMIVDIDDCRVAALESLEICSKDNTLCVNTNGSFDCVCVDGYELVNQQCQRETVMIVFISDHFVNDSQGILNEVIEPPPVAIPMLGQENAITFAVETYKIHEVIITTYKYTFSI